MERLQTIATKILAAYKMLGFWGLVREASTTYLKLDSIISPSRLDEVNEIPNGNGSVLIKIPEIVKYNLNFDDLLPCYSSLFLLEKLVQVFPKIKITIFMSIDSRLAKNVNIANYPGWCRKIAQFPKKNFEIAIHGYNHHLSDLAKTPEFKYLSKNEARNLLLKCERALKKAGIKYIRGFRPPRFGMSKGTEQALEDLNYLFLSDLPRFYEEHKDIKIPRIFSNSDIRENEEYQEYKRYKYLLLDSREYYIHRGHLFGYCDNNLTKDTFDNIVRTISSFKKVEFKFLSEIADEINRRR